MPQVLKKPSIVDDIEIMYLGGRCQGVWLRDDLMSVYVRVSLRANIIEAPMIDIANVCVRHPTRRDKGFFTAFLADVEQIGHVYIENVLEARFADFFRGRGYTQVENSGGTTPCFYRLKTK